MNKPATIDTYINGFPKDTQIKLQKIRTIIQTLAPKAEEVISYGMPGFKWNGMIIWFAGYAQHIGLYPKSEAIIVFKNRIKEYKHAKGSIQFPLNQPLPEQLIKDIVMFRLESLKKA